MSNKIYRPGDILPNGLKVDTNHCGLPWPGGIRNNKCGVYYGTVFAHGEYNDALYDAKTGQVLNEKEISRRFNNDKYDYLKEEKIK